VRGTGPVSTAGRGCGGAVGLKLAPAGNPTPRAMAGILAAPTFTDVMVPDLATPFAFSLGYRRIPAVFPPSFAIGLTPASAHRGLYRGAGASLGREAMIPGAGLYGLVAFGAGDEPGLI
jgi:hypothetical protein